MREEALAGETSGSHHVLRQLRDEISDIDRGIVRALNRRVELVSRVKRHKEVHGIDFLDPAREDWILADVARVNLGPLSGAEVQAVFEEILALTKRAVARDGADGPGADRGLSR
jgi:chorismate mutase